MGRGRWEEMTAKYAGTHGKATNTKTNPDKTNYKPLTDSVPATPSSTIGILRNAGKKVDEATGG